MGFIEGTMGRAPSFGRQIEQETQESLIAKRDELMLEQDAIEDQTSDMIDKYGSEREILANPATSKLYRELIHRSEKELDAQIEEINRQIEKTEQKKVA